MAIPFFKKIKYLLVATLTKNNKKSLIPINGAFTREIDLFASNCYFPEKRTTREKYNGRFQKETFGRTELFPKFFAGSGEWGDGRGVRKCFKTCVPQVKKHGRTSLEGGATDMYQR